MSTRPLAGITPAAGASCRTWNERLFGGSPIN